MGENQKIFADLTNDEKIDLIGKMNTMVHDLVGLAYWNGVYDGILRLKSEDAHEEWMPDGIPETEEELLNISIARDARTQNKKDELLWGLMRMFHGEYDKLLKGE